MSWLRVMVLLLLVGSFSHGWELRGLCVSVADGDTLSVLDANRKRQRVRLYGIDCPERTQDYGRVAGGWLRSQALKKTLRVEVVDRDRYGRLVGKVYLGETLLNLELLRLGYAWYYRHYAPEETEFETAEASARSGKLGLWASEDPLAPWEFRRQARRRRH